MSRPIKRIHDLETNKIIDREMNDEEYAQWQKDQANDEARIQAEAQAKAAKQAILDRLGLTEDDLRIVLG